MATVFFDKIFSSRRNMEKYKWKWMVVGALGRMNNMDFEKKKVNYNIVLDVFIICQKLRMKIGITFIFRFIVVPFN